MKFLLRLPMLVAIAYVAICAIMFFAQRSMQYHPDATPMNPASASLASATQETLATSDGERIVTWWIAPLDEKQPVFLYFHGNGANLHARAERFARITKSGAGLLAVSWRGYGGSTGSPTETGLHIDARASYDALVKTKVVSSNRIVLFGESLGTTVATMLAADVPIAALALDSSFDSARDVAERAYPWLPVRWLLLDQYRADLAAPKVKAPVQQFHCTQDPVTPLASAQALHARFAKAASIYNIDGACHVASVTKFEAVLDAFARGAISVSR
jgi:uncharacterized protein